MTLQLKRPCSCTFESYIQSYHPCIYCNGSKEVSYDVELDEWKDENFKVLSNDIQVESWEYAIDKITCVCGDEIILSGDNTKVCKCGRIYRSYEYIKVDESHISEIDYLIEQSKEEERLRHERWNLIEQDEA